MSKEIKNKIEAMKYLVEHNVCGNEWQEAGMYNAIKRIIKSPKLYYYEKDLKIMLKEAEDN